MRHAAGRVVRHGAAELLLGHLFVGHCLDHVGTGHEHVARALDHDVEVGDGRGIHRAAGARPHDGGDLRDDAGRERVAQEKDVGVAAEREHAFLDRAPPESFRPTTGEPILIARSMILTILAALVSDSEPPKTVKSCANA